ncbi:MAG: hypothetical protein ACPGVC_03370, partial [Salibacteraceae bacterium]
MSQIFQKYCAAFLFAALFVFASPLFSQNNNVNDVQKTANELFEQKKYAEAKELYSQLVSLYPKDENFNYRFGACMLFVDVDKTYPLKFLEYAVSKPNVDIDAFYFLGKGYHYNYRFDEAIAYFNKYKSKLDVKAKIKYPVDHDIRYCKNGKSLLVNITNPLVISKRKVSAADFFTSFKLSSMGGRILYAPKELHSSVDKKKGYLPVMYKNSNSNYIYYSSYGSTDKNGLDIFRVHVSDNGIIGKPVRLPESINTQYDERFPFLTEDKTTFYFSSSGHNSMGGADIYMANYDTVSNNYSQVTNLDYSVNTPDDDFMYADVGDGVAFFASTRNSEKGKAYVYKINSKRKAFNIAVLAGNFDSKNTRSCKITVEDLDEHVVVGSFNTNKKSGEYVMRLRNGGKYSFLVEPYGSQTAYKGRVELPMQQDIKLLKQEIEIVYEGDSEKLVIRNLFEEVINPEDQKVIAQVLVENADIEEEKEPEITIGASEMITEIENLISKQEESIIELQNKGTASYNLANQKRELAHKDLEVADQLESQISINDQSPENQSKQKEFADLIQDAKIHSIEAETAYNLGLKYESKISETQSAINSSSGTLVRIKEANEQGNQAEVLALYTAFNNEKAEIDVDGYSKSINTKLSTEKSQMNTSLKSAESIEQQQLELKSEIKAKKAELLATKKKKEKEEIQLVINALENDLEPLENEKNKKLEEAASHETTINQLKTEQDLLAELNNIPSSGENTANSIENDEKQAMLASIKATTQEIEALESANTEVIGASNSMTDELNDSSSVVKGNELANNEDIDTEDLIDADPNTLNEEVNQDNTVVDVASTELAATQPVKTGEDINEEGPTQINTDGNDEQDNNPPSLDIDSQSNNKEDFFDYSSGYEEPVDNVVLVEGQTIPLDITSNTGKLKYTEEELKNAKVVLDESQYNLEYQNEFSAAKEITDSRAKARETQRLNYNWVVSIEKEVAELEYAKTKSTNPSYTSNINDKITELNDQASQKRNFMALNAKIIKQLDEQEEITEESIAAETQDQEMDENVNLAELNEELGTETETDNENGEIQNISDEENTETFVPDSVLAEEPANEIEISNANQELAPDLSLESTEKSELVVENTQPQIENTDEEELVNTEQSGSDTNTSSNNELALENSEFNVVPEENESGSELNSENSDNEPIVIEDLAPIIEAQISPSAAAVAEIEIQSEQQAVAITEKETELDEIQSELNNAKKKKDKKRLATELEIKEAEVAYEKRKLKLVDEKKTNIT